MALLLYLLFFSLALQFIVTTANSLSSDIDKTLNDVEQSNATLSSEIAAIVDSIGTKELSDPSLSVGLKKSIATIHDLDRKIKLDLDRSFIKASAYETLTTFGLKHTNYELSGFAPRKFINDFNQGTVEYYTFRDGFGELEEHGRLALRVLSAILPILLGTLGACAYVTRLISDQIRDTTFSSTSRDRHLVRVGLGALVGGLVGVGWIYIGFSVSTLAAAFAAGYAVEPVFAAIDGIAEKFRNP